MGTQLVLVLLNHFSSYHVLKGGFLMKITFKRTNYLLGFAAKMDILVNQELVHRLKRGETYVYEVDTANHILIDSWFIRSVEIPIVPSMQDVEIELSYQMGLLVAGILAKVSSNGQLIGVYESRM